MEGVPPASDGVGVEFEDRTFWRHSGSYCVRGQAAPCKLGGSGGLPEDVLDFRLGGACVNDPHELGQEDEVGLEDEAGKGFVKLGAEPQR